MEKIFEELKLNIVLDLNFIILKLINRQVLV